MTRPRLTTARVALVAEHLSERDVDIVATLAKLRLATTAQLLRLHFADASPLSNARRGRRTLERLTNLGVLSRLVRRIGGVRSGSAGFVYALGPAGQRLNGGHGPAGGRRIRRPWTPSLPFVAHVLGVTELYVGLFESDRRGEIELLRFDAEPAAWRRFTGPGGARVTLKPDAFVVVGVDEFEEHRFVELDRATESRSTIATKLRTYCQYWASGREQHRGGVFPGVLFVVPDERRQAELVDECGRQPAESWHLFQVVIWREALSVMRGGRS